MRRHHPVQFNLNCLSVDLDQTANNFTMKQATFTTMAAVKDSLTKTKTLDQASSLTLILRRDHIQDRNRRLYQRNQVETIRKERHLLLQASTRERSQQTSQTLRLIPSKILSIVRIAVRLFLAIYRQKQKTSTSLNKSYRKIINILLNLPMMLRLFRVSEGILLAPRKT